MNKLKLACTLLLSFSFVQLNAQINVQWQTGYDNSNGIDQCVGIVVDAVGNSYVTGTSNNGTDFDIVTIKYDISGAEQWTSTYDGAANSTDEAKAIAMDGAGNIYVTGHTFTAGTDQDIVTIKYNPTTGAELWSNEFTGTSNYDLSGDIAIDGNNNIYVTGTRDHLGEFRVTTIKYNSAGVEQWNDTFNDGLTGIHFGKKLTIDASNNVYVLCEIETASNGQDFGIVKYAAASTGNIDWSETYDADGSDDIPTDIHSDGGFLYATGGSYISDLSHKEDYYTIKVNSSTGAEIWGQLFNGSGSDKDIANSVITDVSGHVYITGSSIGDTTAQDFLTVGYDDAGTFKWSHIYSSLDANYDVGNQLILGTSGDIYASGTSFQAGQSNDYITLKFNTDGDMLWETRFDGPAANSDNAIGMFVDPTENIYITGKSKSISSNFDYRTIKYCQLTTIASNDTSVCIGESVPLTATGGSNYEWNVVSGDPVMSCTSCQSPNVTPNSTTTYAVSSESGSGCIDFDTVIVTINPLPGPSIYTDGPVEFCLGDSVELSTDEADEYLWNDVTASTDSILIVHTSGNYSVTVEDSMGCQNSTSIMVTVNNLPVIDGGTDHAICIGDSTQLDASGALSYLWTFDPTIDDHADGMTWVYPTATTTYEVVGTDVNGCKDTGDVVITINPLPTPFDLTIVDDTMIVSPHTFGNEWFFNTVAQPGISGNEVDFCDDAFGPGSYWILYTDANNCSNYSDTVNFTIDDTTLCWRPEDDTNSVNEFLVEDTYIHVFPNPSSNFINITFENNNIPSAIQIYGMDGKMVLSSNNIKPMEILDISSIEKGQYFIIFQFEDGKIARKKLIKN